MPFLRSALTPLVCAALAAAAAASPKDRMREIEQDADAAREHAAIAFKVEAGTTIQFRTDLKDQGDVFVSRSLIEVTGRGALGDRAALSVTVGFEPTFYDFRNAPGLIPGTNDPISDVYLFDVSPRFTMAINEEWSWFAGLDARVAGESDARFGDAFTIGGYAGASQKVNENFTYSFGVYAVQRMEDDALVVPIIGFDWKINDDLRFESIGTGLKLTSAINDTLEVAALGYWDRREYRLDRNHSQLPNGVFREQRVPVGVQLAWKPDPAVRVTLEGGAVVWQEYRVLNSNGNRLNKQETDPAPYISLNAVFRF